VRWEHGSFFSIIRLSRGAFVVPTFVLLLPGMLHATVVTQISEFSGLRAEWFNLISRSSSATVFDTFEWQFCWWRRIGKKRPGSKLQIVLLRDDSGLLIGILPLYTKIWACWPMRRLYFIGSGFSDYHDVIAATGYEEGVVREFRRCLIELIKWSIADLNQLREGGVLRNYLQPEDLTVFNILELAQEECPYLALPQGSKGEERWELLLAGYSKKMRGNVRYYNRALDRVYSVERIVAGTRDEVNEALTALFILHQRRWNERWLPGVFYSRAARDFHRAAATDLLDRGLLRLHYLKLDNSVEAVLYCFSLKGVSSYYQGGFEPTLSRLSLGSVVTGLAIHQAVIGDDIKFDFLRGNEPYKRRWTLGASAWNHRWVMARKNFLPFPGVVAVTRLELRVEHRLKEWMHHQGSRKSGDPAEKGDK